MAMIGTIKEISTVDGQHTVIIETGSGPAVTATVMQSAGVDFQPLAGDRAVYHYAGSEVVVSAIFSEDATSGPGEWLVFSRDSAGVVQAKVHLKSDGTVNCGTGADFVSMSTTTDQKIEAIYNAIAAAVVGSADGGATFRTNIIAALDISWPAIGSIASTNLKAD